MITCDCSQEAIVLAAHGELDTARLSDLKAHLRACASCLEQAREVQSARELFAAAEGHVLPEPWIPSAARAMTVLPTRIMLLAATILVAALVVFATSRLGRPEIPDAGPRLASGSPATDVGAITDDAYLGDDGLGDEIESLQSELASLESKVGEF